SLVHMRGAADLQVIFVAVAGSEHAAQLAEWLVCVFERQVLFPVTVTIAVECMAKCGQGFVLQRFGNGSRLRIKAADKRTGAFSIFLPVEVGTEFDSVEQIIVMGATEDT